MIKSLVSKMEDRKKYNTFSEMPDWLVVFFALSSFIVAAFYGYVLGKVVPEYLEIANQTPLHQWGWRGWVVTIILSAIAFIVWHCGSVSWRCNGIIRDRWYK